MSTHLLEFARISGSGRNSAHIERQIHAILDGSVAVTGNAFDEADHLRQVLVNKGFRYDDSFFRAPEIVRHQAGNCLGLSLLIGGALLDRGFHVSFVVVTHPQDGIHNEDVRLFGELIRGEHFQYNDPPLPTLSDASEADALAPVYRFAVLEHPVLVAGGRYFEVTSLEETDVERIPKAERLQPASFEEVLGGIHLDMARSIHARSRRHDLIKVRELLESSVALWPTSREAWRALYNAACDLDNEELKRTARSRFEAIGGDDSAFYDGLYDMTGDPAFLDTSLERFPENILTFTTRRVELEPNDREAKFNLAVAAYCALNSCAIDLKRFYRRYSDSVTRLYGYKMLKHLAA